MHWFLVKQSSTNLKKTLNTCLYKLSFCYFYHDEIYLSHENFHKFSLGLYKTQIIEKNEMENYKFEVKRVTHLKAIHTIAPCYFVILYFARNSVTSLV